MKKIIDLVFIIMTLVIILSLIVFVNREQGKVSGDEKRMLADPPTAEFGTAEWKTQLVDWVNDNIGFRDQLLNMRTTLMFKGLNIMTTEKVQKGKDGFYFYTLDNNIDIAKGTYPIDENKLMEIAEAQQTISDYYKKIGKQYVLVLTPSKVSIYPEYLYGNYVVGETPVDIICDYLTENTDVMVINTKDKLLENKDEGQLFWKTDAHWTQLGAYYAYLAIIEGMNEAKFTDIIPVEVDKTKDKIIGEFSAMIGDKNILGIEYADGIIFDETSQLISEGEYCDKLNEICHLNGVGTASTYNVKVFSNDNNLDKPRLLMLTDSQFMIMRKIPNLLAESFSEVVLTRARKVVPEMDELTDPDIVIFSCSERYTSSLLSDIPEGISLSAVIPGDINGIIPDMVMSQQQNGYNGMYLDYVNEVNHHSKEFSQGNIPRKVYEDSGTVIFTGWAADFIVNKPLSKLYLKIGERTVECEYGIERISVSDHFQNEDLKMTGFTATVPQKYLDESNKLEFIQVGNDGTYRFESVDYIFTD